MDGSNTMTIQSILLELIFIFKKAYYKHNAESNRLVALGVVVFIYHIFSARCRVR